MNYWWTWGSVVPVGRARSSRQVHTAGPRELHRFPRSNKSKQSKQLLATLEDTLWWRYIFSRLKMYCIGPKTVEHVFDEEVSLALVAFFRSWKWRSYDRELPIACLWSWKGFCVRLWYHLICQTSDVEERLQLFCGHFSGFQSGNACIWKQPPRINCRKRPAAAARHGNQAQFEMFLELWARCL